MKPLSLNLNTTTWSYENGVLTIGGKGMMEDYYDEENEEMLESPWEEYVDEITTIVIENGVTSIGDYAFSFCESLTTVTIDNSADAVTIGEYAIPSGCTVTYTK